MFAVLTLLACLPLPDFRRPATLVVLEGEAATSATGLTVRACTWSARYNPLEGCAQMENGDPSRDGIGVREWSAFPLVLGLSTPLWSDAFVACEGTRPRGITFRLPDLRVKHNAELGIVLDAPPTRWGENARMNVSDEDAAELASRMCAGTQPLRAE